MLVLGASTQTLRAQPADPADLLTRMAAAVHSIDYQGSFIYERNGHVDALRLFHQGSAERNRERLLSLSGPRSEVLRDGDDIVCVQPPAPVRRFASDAPSRLLPLVPDTQTPKFAEFYSLAARGRDRVAGYVADVIDIGPRDGYRYGYRVWLENDTHLLLRSAIVDAGGRILEQFMFVELEIGARPREADLALAATDAPLIVDGDEVPIGNAPGWRVSQLPPGFVLRSARRPAQAPTQVEHHVYSDGIANVSVYIEPRDVRVAVPADSASTLGAVSICGHSEQAWTFTAVGDVPPATVQRMARSVEPLRPAAP